MAAPAISPETVVIVAPTGADATNIRTVLQKAGVDAAICPSAADAPAWVKRGPGMLLMTEEALGQQHHGALARAFETQPPWSDVPLVIVTSQSSLHRWAALSTSIFGNRGNITLVARPAQASTLVAAVQAALRARRRQYEVRDLLQERDALLGSLEARVQERTGRLQELVAELESFSYSVSHDLRAPLRVMAGYARVVLDDYGATLAPEVRHYLERIARSADRMDLLTQDVLAYTRLARGEMSLGPVDVEKTVEETIEQYPHLASARAAIVVRRPLAAVLAHAPSLVQVLSNLLGNAIKFARPNVPLQVGIWTEPRGDRVRIFIQDNGVGIDPAYHAKVFRIFERAVGQEIPGTGIGLAIVKKAAERMGGSVGVMSSLGGGSTFWMELAKPPEAAANGAAGAP